MQNQYQSLRVISVIYKIFAGLFILVICRTFADSAALIQSDFFAFLILLGAFILVVVLLYGAGDLMNLFVDLYENTSAIAATHNEQRRVLDRLQMSMSQVAGQLEAQTRLLEQFAPADEAAPPSGETPPPDAA